ncbi:MAG TPA: DNA gyrase subunit A [Acidimicrobiia bacterium]|nr:DNA gyrase subunit A [Acidimicrobiia bacterium]
MADDNNDNGSPSNELDITDSDVRVSIEPIEIQEEMERSFLDYAMSVIVSRALPDARDGLKPVHRRILYGMYDAGLRPDRPYTKCAQVVGAVMGKLHPHGDSAIYDALARMVQDFSLRHPLVDGHGAFGSPDPDSQPAAMRYTECRLAPLAMQMLAGLDEDTVDFVDTYDGKEREPVVLPSRFPNLLVNGSQGIAVGMATNIPPHNLGEVIDAVIHTIDNPDATPDDLMAFVQGPDFPTGAQILGRAGIVDAYRTGRGSIKMRAVAEIEEGKNNSKIVVTELPYQTAVETIEKKIAELVNNHDLDGIRELRNESAKGATRLVVELKRDANANVVLNNLYKLTPMQTSFGANMLALVDGIPRMLNLAQAISAYVEHQKVVIRRRSEYRLQKALDRSHIVEGLLRALDMLDAVIATIRGSQDAEEARTALMATPFDFSEIQANHILDMPLRRLTGLEKQKLIDEYDELQALITGLRAILNDESMLKTVIKEEMIAIKEQYATPRKSIITADASDINVLDLIDDEELVMMLTKNGYVKTVTIDAFRTQGRGGRGVSGGKLKDEDYVTHLLTTTAHSYLLFFTNRGRVYRLRAHEIPMKDRTARGTALVNLLSLDAGESVQAVIDTRTYEDGAYLLFTTKRGVVKKTRMNDYDTRITGGLIAVNLREDDELVAVVQTNGTNDIFLTSRDGMTIRFDENDVRAMGRNASGVRGMKLKNSHDEVVGCDVAREGAVMLFVSSQGYGKRTEQSAFNRQGRGGQGVRGVKVSPERGNVVAAFTVDENDEILVFSSAGNLIRTHVSDISLQGRAASGVKVARPGDEEQIVAVARVLERDDKNLEEDQG